MPSAVVTPVIVPSVEGMAPPLLALAALPAWTVPWLISVPEPVDVRSICIPATDTLPESLVFATQ